MPVKIDFHADYYDILGISSEASPEEIKKAYRKLALLNHPDTGGEADAFRRILEAYEVLFNPTMRATYNGNRQTTPCSNSARTSRSQPRDYSETVEVNGVSIRITYGLDYYSDALAATIDIFARDLKRITELPPVRSGVRYIEVVIFDEDGSVLCRSRSLESARRQVEQTRIERMRLKTAEDRRKKLAEFQRELKELTRKDLPVDRLTELVIELAEKLNGAFYVHRWATDEAAILSIIASIEKEIERLKADPAEVIREYFLAGKIPHPHVAANRGVLAEIESWEIRSDRLFELPSKEALREFYLERLAGVTTLRQLRLTDLRLRLEDYVPESMIGDPELTLAPKKIVLRIRRRGSDHPVSYRYSEDGQSKPIGVVRVPCNVFMANSSDFPKLPYGIVLIVIVTSSDDPNRIIARGPADDSLVRKVQKFQAGQKRGEAFDAGDPYGFGRKAPVKGTPVPPWFQGRRPR